MVCRFRANAKAMRPNKRGKPMTDDGGPVAEGASSALSDALMAGLHRIYNVALSGVDSGITEVVRISGAEPLAAEYLASNDGDPEAAIDDLVRWQVANASFV